MYTILKNKNALYIEDDKIVLENTSSILKNYFYKLYTANNGTKGYELFTEHNLDLIFVDIELPDINGIELIKKIRLVNPDIQIVIISAYTNTDYLLDSIELKLNKYIVKPLTSKKLSVLLDSLNCTFLPKNNMTISGTIYDKNEFTKKELEFLDILIKNSFITYDELDTLWHEPPTQNALRLFIKHLRNKLPNIIIKNQSGLGYFFDK